MIKILHFITDTNIGGAGRLLCTQIRNMGQSEFDISVALPRGSALINEMKSAPCHIVECDGGVDSSLSLHDVFECVGIIKTINPDIVHSHASLSSRIAAYICSVPSRIFTRHCVFPVPKIYENALVRGAFRVANNLLSTRIVAVAESAKQNLVDMGCDKSKIEVIINGVVPIKRMNEDEKSAARNELGIENDDFVISIFARLEEYKGHKILLLAAEKCIEKHPNFKFLIVGDGSRKNELVSLANELKINKNVIFCGFCGDVNPLFNITDVNVNCSFGTETSSLSLSEGMSIGVPAVVSDYGGNTYMVRHGVNGLVFPQKDADSLAESLMRLYCDRELYERCSVGAKERYFEELNANFMCKKMAELYLSEYDKSKR